eukprot:gene22664-biopygen22999
MAFMSDRNRRPASHESLTHSVPFSGTASQCLFSMGSCRRMQTPSVMRFTRAGGLASFLTFCSAFGSMESNALFAASSIGCAAARSCSASSLTAWTAFASFISISFTAPTSASFFSATPVASVISNSSASVSFVACCKLTSFSARLIFICRTSSPAWCSFFSPPPMFSARTLICWNFSAYTTKYDSRNERYDFGVENTLRLNRVKYSTDI